MADPALTFGPADMRAAVAADILTEAQAASLTALAQERAGKRLALPAEDEPFEFFRGFSEVFVAIGLVILVSGAALGSALMLFGGGTGHAILPLAGAAVAWWWAEYFTLKRRMNLPSMVLATAFGCGIFLAATLIVGGNVAPRAALVGSFAVTALAMAAWYRRFRLPFSAFILGLFLLGSIYSLTAPVSALTGLLMRSGSAVDLFDLRQSPQFALATLAFGIAAFVAAMWFDTRDPHRLGRHAATAFWLHLLAAPALVNTVALTLYNVGGAVGVMLLAVSLSLIAVLALIIDRRSFLTAAIVYIALVISWVVQGGRDESGAWAVILIALGALVTALGTWWVPLRSALMRTLPGFPGKDCLPPYARTP